MPKFDDKSSVHQLVLRGQTIREDADGHICLDDIWQLAKATSTRAPKVWRGRSSTKRLETELQKKVTKSALMAETRAIPVAYAKRGRGNKGTFAHPVLAAAYAGYLSPKLKIEVLEVWLRYRAGDAALADEILQRASASDNEWAAVRALSRSKRVGYTDTLRDHGVTGRGYPQCTNAVYQEVLDGTAKQIKSKMGLPEKANLRDHMDTSMLSFVMAAEVLATDRINDEGCLGNDECAKATARSASFIREAIERDKKDRQPRMID